LVILNRDLRGSSVPVFSYTEISDRWGADDELESSHQFALAELKRFGATFDPWKFEEETGKSFGEIDAVPGILERIGSNGETDRDLSELRWALWHLACGPQYPIDGVRVDRALNGIHWILTGAKRVTVGPGPYEPWIGTKAMSIGGGQLRFWLYTGPGFDRERLFGFVAGLLLRRYGDRFIARSLGLYPPSYPRKEDGLVKHRFMVLITRAGADSSGHPEGDDAEQQEFAAFAIREALNSGLGVVPEPD
jgi:hypothetical protein